ncbi:MAG: tryptophan 7-halogenase [Bacteroidetes bacterium]|nr:tryptophan 7-halogenase [Bacteroidota bacterium]
MNHFDIIIVGAGPAGTACALSLKDSGLKVLILDKNTFPRDKVCGDAIPNTVPKALKMLDENYLEALRSFPEKINIDSCKVIAPSGKSVTLHFKLEGYASARMDFDNFMLKLAEKESMASIVTGDGVQEVTMSHDQVEVTTEKGNRFYSKIIIGCDGAHSVLNKKLTTTKIDHDHYIGAVRAYYKNVKGLQPNTMEIHLVKGFMPGYFWIFPLTNNSCNTGFRMVSSSI